MDSTSVFDLSPNEKLQLVEDLWDDLAANPEEIPGRRRFHTFDPVGNRVEFIDG